MQIYLGYNKVGQSSDYILTVLSNHQKGKASSIKTIEKTLPFVYPPKRSSIPHEITTYLGKEKRARRRAPLPSCFFPAAVVSCYPWNRMN